MKFQGVSIKALQGLSLTLRDHTNTNLTKWTVYTGGYGVEISDSHQDQTITGLAFFQSRRHGLSKSREKARLQSGWEASQLAQLSAA